MVIKIFIGHFTRLTNSPSVFAGARAQVREGGVTQLCEVESGGRGRREEELGLGRAPGLGAAVSSKRAGRGPGPRTRTGHTVSGSLPGQCGKHLPPTCRHPTTEGTSSASPAGL